MILQRLERFVQEYEANVQDEHARTKDAKMVSQALTEKASEMHAVTPHRTIQRGEPPTRSMPTSPQVQSLSARKHYSCPCSRGRER